jgi:hypothetical protein
METVVTIWFLLSAVVALVLVIRALGTRKKRLTDFFGTEK